MKGKGKGTRSLGLVGSRWFGLLLAGLVAAGCSDNGKTSVGADAAAEVGVDLAPADVAPEVAVETGPEAPPAGTPTPLTILHTNDLHSHLQGHAPETDYSPGTVGDDLTTGGFARLATAIGNEKQAALTAGGDVLLVDGGDFMMGTLFQLASTTAAAELGLMHAAGYDAIALGNHEFDWTSKGLAGILAAAVTNKTVVPLLASNLRFSPMPGDDELEQFSKEPGPIKTKLVKTTAVGGLKVGFIGLLGTRAQQYATGSQPATFVDYKGAEVKAIVDELRQVDKVDLVVALSHSGINAEGIGDDRALAEANLGIDVIVSGHSHDKLEQPLQIGRTVIVTAGSYGSHLGRLDLEVFRDAGVVTGFTVKGYKLIPINDQIPGFAPIQAKVDQVIAGLDMVLTPLGLGYRKPVAETTFDIGEAAFKENAVGNLITDAYLGIARALQPAELADISFEANGSIRSAVQKGSSGAVWFADLFRVVPLGIGPDGLPGYPLITIYLNGRDLRAGLELSAAANSVTLGRDDAVFLQFSGVQADVKMSNLLFQRVTGARLVKPDGTTAPIDLKDEKTCYKVVTTYYLGALFGFANSKLPPALSLRAKEKDCATPITSLASRIIDRDPATPALEELKQWQALARFVATRPDSDMDGVPNLPQQYAQPQGRLTLIPATP